MLNLIIPIPTLHTAPSPRSVPRATRQRYIWCCPPLTLTLAPEVARRQATRKERQAFHEEAQAGHGGASAQDAANAALGTTRRIRTLAADLASRRSSLRRRPEEAASRAREKGGNRVAACRRGGRGPVPALDPPPARIGRCCRSSAGRSGRYARGVAMWHSSGAPWCGAIARWRVCVE